MKHDGGTSANQSPEFILAAMRALLERGIFDILKLFKFMGTGIAMIIVCRHGQ